MQSVRKVRVRCGTCGEVAVLANTIELSADAADPASYTFGCPLCRSARTRSCTSVAARMLLLSGARMAPMPAPQPATTRRTLGHEHIHELRRLLDHPDWPTWLRDAGA